MSDFHQNGLVTVLHRLGASNLDLLEKELERHAATNPPRRIGARPDTLRPGRNRLCRSARGIRRRDILGRS